MEEEQQRCIRQTPLPHCSQSLHLKGSRVGNTFLKEWFVFSRATSKEAIFGTKVTSQSTRWIWRITAKGSNFSLCNLAIIIINHPDAANCQMRPFRDVISAICQRTRRVWMWWLMSVWSHLSQREAEWRPECSKEGDLSHATFGTSFF